MSHNNSLEKMITNATEMEEAEYNIELPAFVEYNSDTNDMAAPTMVNKAIQVDMDNEPDSGTKHNIKYWQDLAGLRGAREQYLQLDVLDLGAEIIRQTNYIKYLKEKLDRAMKEIWHLRAQQCRCEQLRLEREMLVNKSFSSIGL